jgi:dTDP-4-amino-4,6-dideoxygalactose transaminase
MSELQAALGLHQLGILDQTSSLMRKKAGILMRKLRSITGLVLPYEASYATHVYNLFVVRIIPKEFGCDRNKVAAVLRRKGIETQLHYVPIHRLTFFVRNVKFKKNSLKVSDSLWNTVLSLPLHPTIRNEELNRISDALIGCGKSNHKAF